MLHRYAPPAAQAFGLSFIPLSTERYDLIIHRHHVHLPAVQVLLDVLNRAAVRRKLELLAGYDTSHTGEVLCSVNRGADGHVGKSAVQPTFLAPATRFWLPAPPT